MDDDEKFGFIIMDGSGCLFGTLSGNTRTVLHKLTVDLPKKHGRGGQSAVRFARLRNEKRHNYVRKVAELAVQFFITNDRPNVSGLILAGLADFKNQLEGSDMFDQRLKRIVIGVVDVQYGGENGFNQAIELSQDHLKNVKFMKEKKVINGFFDEIAIDSGKYCFGVKDTMTGLEAGCIETLIVYDELDINRVEMVNPSGEKKVAYLTPEQTKTAESTKSEWDIVEAEPLVDWFVENYKTYNTSLQFVTNKSPEGSQFQKGFGGIGGILKYQYDFSNLDGHVDTIESDEELDEDEEFDLDF